MRNVSKKYSRGNKNTHFILSDFFFENRAVYELMWKNVVQPDMQQMTVWRMRIACWIPKVTNTYSEYVLLIAFLLQQWVHERASKIACFVLVGGSSISYFRDPCSNIRVFSCKTQLFLSYFN
jgi:hypothetical protein